MFEGDASEKVARNLAGTAAWSAFWLSRFGVALAFGATGPLPPLLQVAVYSMLAVAPVAYLLAGTVVLLVDSGNGSTAAGKAGNVAGGLLTALVFMQWLGVAAAVAPVSGLLLLAALEAWQRLAWRLLAAGVVAAAGVRRERGRGA